MLDKQLIKYFSLGIAYVLIFTLGVIGLNYFDKLNTSSVIHFVSAPAGVKVSATVLNESLNGNNLINVKPGEYTLSFKKDGFESIIKNIKVAEKQTVTVPVSLTPLNEAASREMSSRNNLQLAQDAASVILSQENEFQAPINSRLPYSNFLFNINRNEAVGTNALVISALPGYNNSALTYIRGWGYKLGELDISFGGTEDPFKS